MTYPWVYHPPMLNRLLGRKAPEGLRVQPPGTVQPPGCEAYRKDGKPCGANMDEQYQGHNLCDTHARLARELGIIE